MEECDGGALAEGGIPDHLVDSKLLEERMSVREACKSVVSRKLTAGIVTMICPSFFGNGISSWDSVGSRTMEEQKSGEWPVHCMKKEAAVMLTWGTGLRPTFASPMSHRRQDVKYRSLEGETTWRRPCAQFAVPPCWIPLVLRISFVGLKGKNNLTSC